MVNNKKYVEESNAQIHTNMWVKCKKCSSIIYREDLMENNKVCVSCGYHMRLTAEERITQIVDEGTFIQMYEDIETQNILGFEGYEKKIQQSKLHTNSSEAVMTGVGEIGGISAALGVMDSYFMIGSMGTAVGERITRLVEYATAKSLPLILFTASGGARMQEGILALMQMAKVSGAISRHDEVGLFYLVVLTDPTTGGVTASFAMQGDIIISEPSALVGFAGRRVIDNTIKEELPHNFQRAEFLKDKGMIDAIVERQYLKKYIYALLSIHVEALYVS